MIFNEQYSIKLFFLKKGNSQDSVKVFGNGQGGETLRVNKGIDNGMSHAVLVILFLHMNCQSPASVWT